MNNFYEILEIDRSLSCSEIEAALRQSRRKWRVRMNAPALEDRQEAERMAAAIDEAASILTKPDLREQYDSMLGQNQTPEDVSRKVSSQEPNAAEIVRQLEELLSAGKMMDMCQLSRFALDQGLCTAEIYYYYALGCINTDDGRQAVMILRQALETMPDEYLLQYLLAQYLLLTKEYEEAFEIYAALAQNGYNDTFDVSVGMFTCYMELGREPMAYEVINRYLAVHADDQVYRSKAQKSYLRLIGDPQNVLGQGNRLNYLNKMLDYAKKADHILSSGRSREMLQIIQNEISKAQKKDKLGWFSGLF